MFIQLLSAIVLAVSSVASFAGGDSKVDEVFKTLHWVRAPQTGQFDNHAEIKLVGDQYFLNAADTNKFLQATGNLPTNKAYVIGNAKRNWFAVFEFVDDGLVKDDEKIDPDELLTSLKKSNIAGNEQRRQQGLQEMDLAGWFFPPRYDAISKRMEWGLEYTTPNTTGKTVNINTKILGRRGYYQVILVTSPNEASDDLEDFKTTLKQFDYVAGEKYSEWKEGDKVAAYGLSALILGGAAAVATKKGLWVVISGFVAAFWKLLAGLVAAAFAGINSLLKKKKSDSA